MHRSLQKGLDVCDTALTSAYVTLYSGGDISLSIA